MVGSPTKILQQMQSISQLKRTASRTSSGKVLVAKCLVACKLLAHSEISERQAIAGEINGIRRNRFLCDAFRFGRFPLSEFRTQCQLHEPKPKTQTRRISTIRQVYLMPGDSREAKRQPFSGYLTVYIFIASTNRRSKLA